MIPFARILNYGNTVAPPAQIKKLVGTDSGLRVLYDTGVLRLRGNGSNYNMGNNSNVTISDSWVTCPYSVADVWGNTYCTYILSTDGKIYHAGNTSSYTSSTVDNRTWTDITNILVGITPTLIKDIKVTSTTNINASTLILMSNGDLYGIGRNSNTVLGVTGAVTTPRLLDTGVTLIESSDNQCNFHYIKDGIYYRCGLNSSYQLSTGDTNSLITFQPYSFGVRKVVGIHSVRDLTVLIIQDNSNYLYFASGRNTYFLVGNSADTALVYSSFTQQSISTVLNGLSFDNMDAVTFMNVLRGGDKLIYTCGGQPGTSGLGLGRTTSQNLNMRRGNFYPIEFEDESIDATAVSHIAFMGSLQCSILSIGNDLYWCGLSSNFTEQGSTNQVKFKKMIN